MKKERKFLCLVLSVVLLFSCFTSQSYALFDFLKKDPEVKAVTVTSFEVTDSVPISVRDVENQFEQDTWYVSDRSEENLAKEAEKLYYHLGDGSISMAYKLTLSDGQEKEGYFPARSLIAPDDSASSGEKVRTNVDAYVRYKDLFEAAENGKSTVTVKYSVSVYVTDGSKNENGEYNRSMTDSYIIEKEREIIPSYVKKLEIVSGVPETVVKKPNRFFSSCHDFREAVFSYELYDGRKGTEKVTFKKSDTFSFYLAGEYLYIRFDSHKGEFTINMLDTTITSKAEVVDATLVRVEFVDYSLDENENLAYVSCVAYNCYGKKYEFTVHADEQYLDFIEGVPVRVYYSKGKSSQYENAEAIVIKAEIDNVKDNERVIELSMGCPCICHKDGIGQVLFKIANVFWKLFGINRECLECSATHY